jgi:hypothetical protein
MKLSSILLEMLNEIGGNTYNFSKPVISKRSKTSSIVKYSFENVNKTKYNVLFESRFFPDSREGERKWGTDVSFDVVKKKDKYAGLYEPSTQSKEDKFRDTGEGDAAAVFFTVANIIKDFITTFKPESVTYSGGMSDKEMKKNIIKVGDTSRDRIYDKMVAQMINKIPGYDFRREGFNMEIFHKGGFPVPGHHKIFDYPVKK